MATVEATGDAATMRRVMDTIDARAAEIGRGGDRRPVGQRRLSALADYVLGPQAESRPSVQTMLTIDLTTLLGITRRPGYIDGYGPISSDTARELSADATLRRLLTDPVTGVMVDLGRVSYRPSSHLRRLIEARDRTCRFPACTRPATKSDIDHVSALNDHGATASPNLHPLCRMHHNLKTRKLWKVDVNPDGTETWTTPFGLTYTTPAAIYPIEDLEPPGDPEPAERYAGAAHPIPLRDRRLIPTPSRHHSPTTNSPRSSMRSIVGSAASPNVPTTPCTPPA
jgi:hypothetical protein